MDEISIAALILIPLVAVLSPLLSAGLSRFIRIPLVVFEIVLGLLIGPSVLGWVEPTAFTTELSEFGLAMLFFLAGNEIDFERIRGRALNRSIVGWVVALVVAVLVGVLVAPTAAAGVFVGIALTSTALGTLMPVLRDAGELRTAFGTAVIAIGAVGEFGPLIAISLFLSGRQPGKATVVLVIFVLITAGAIYLSSRGMHRRLHELINATLHTSGQFAVRLIILVLASLVALSLALDLDMLLGAFAAGVLTKLLLVNARPADLEVIETKIEAIGFGFLVPVFFVFTGVTFDLDALVSSRSALIMLPVFLVLLIVIRGLSGLATAPKGTSGRDKRAIVLFTATGLPIIVAVTGIGVKTHDLTSGTASALVGAGMLSVLLFPLLALGQHRSNDTPAAGPPVSDDDHVPEEG